MSSQLEKENYKESLKATSLFGGVQIYNILTTIIRSKIIALLLGPEGMGILGLLTSTTGLITSCTNFGLNTSAVKDISEANNSEDHNKISRIIIVFKRLIWLTGLLGLLVCLLFSPYWSKITFGSYSYTIAFAILSITLLFTQLSSGQTALLQGMHQYSNMAKANIIGSTLGLVITTPLYFFWGINAIVPGIILTTFTTLCISWYYSRKIKTERLQLNHREIFKEGKNMIQMGVFLALQGLLSVLAGYIIRIFINRTGGIEEVGLYSAGFAIVNTYVGLVFTAMGTEYYPRLAKVSKSQTEFTKTINQQIEISILLLSPIIAFFIIFANMAITIFYSNKFIGINGMIYWTILGIFLKAPSWCIAFSFIAKGDTKAFFWNEFTAIIYTTILNIIFYKYMGLTGLGISFFIGYFIYLIQVKWICHIQYKYQLDHSIWKLFIPHFLLSIGCMMSVVISSTWIKYTIGTIIISIASILVYKELNSRIDLHNILKKKFRK